MVPKTKLSIDVADLRDLIVPGLGNRRIFRILLTDACRHSCDDCPMRAERDLAPHALDAARLARLFMTAFRRGWCDGLFITSGIPKDPVRAMDRMLELVEILRVAHGYRGYLHVKAVAGAEVGQIERLVRLVDRVSYHLEVPCRRAQEQNAKRLELEISFSDVRVRPDSSQQLSLGDPLAGPFKQGHEEVEGAASYADGFAAVQQKSLARENLEVCERKNTID